MGFKKIPGIPKVHGLSMGSFRSLETSGERKILAGFWMQRIEVADG